MPASSSSRASGTSVWASAVSRISSATHSIRLSSVAAARQTLGNCSSPLRSSHCGASSCHAARHATPRRASARSASNTGRRASFARGLSAANASSVTARAIASRSFAAPLGCPSGCAPTRAVQVSSHCQSPSSAWPADRASSQPPITRRTNSRSSEQGAVSLAWISPTLVWVALSQSWSVTSSLCTWWLVTLSAAKTVAISTAHAILSPTTMRFASRASAWNVDSSSPRAVRSPFSSSAFLVRRLCSALPSSSVSGASSHGNLSGSSDAMPALLAVRSTCSSGDRRISGSE